MNDNKIPFGKNANEIIFEKQDILIFQYVSIFHLDT